MKVVIEAESQDEFDSKREELVKAIAGRKLDVRIVGRSRKTVYDAEKPTMTPRKARYRAQGEVLNHFSELVRHELEELKREIGAVIG